MGISKSVGSSVKILKNSKLRKFGNKEKKWRGGGGEGGGGSVRGLWKERESPSLFDFVLCGGLYVCYFRQ